MQDRYRDRCCCRGAIVMPGRSPSMAYSAPVQVVSAIHQRFPEVVSLPLLNTLQASLQAPSKAVLAAMSQEQREKDETSRITKQRGLLRVYAELELVGIVRPEKNASPGDATFAIFRDLVTCIAAAICIQPANIGSAHGRQRPPGTFHTSGNCLYQESGLDFPSCSQLDRGKSSYTR